MPVHCTIEDAVARLTLDEPGRKNAMTPELGDALQARVAQLKQNPAVRAVVLHGAGGTFSGGGDLSMLERLRSVTPDESRAFMRSFYARYLSVLDLEVPTIAVVEGAAIGAGFCLSLACDQLVVEDTAKLALNFVQLGLHPGMGATYLVPFRTSPQTAARLLLGGERFDGRAAQAFGFTSHVTPAGEALPRGVELARSLAAQAPLAVRALKRSLGPDREALERCLEEEARQQSISYASADMAEGLAAAAARRAPVFTGR
ncbi:MAG: enoyl-CoA hydratase-related protein [Myxococcaceae bacterium]|nr:enoyl-CoA hydratase-related protein [Myxococcaceae bacterium]